MRNFAIADKENDKLSFSLISLVLTTCKPDVYLNCYNTHAVFY